MSTFTFYIKLCFLLLSSSVLLLFGCDNNYVIEQNQSQALTVERFYQTPGFKLDYDLYLPNSYSGWEPSDNNKFSYDPDKQVYSLKPLDISHAPIDNFGERFKITSVDWQHELGFTSTDSYIEESKIGLAKEAVLIFNIKYFSISDDSKDMYFELPKEANPAYLHVKVKVISNKSPAVAWLMISYTEK